MTDPATLQELAKRHLMMHFTSHGRYDSEDVPIISRGEGCWLCDTNGKRYFDGLSGLFCTQIGYSFGAELGEAAAKQMAELPFLHQLELRPPAGDRALGEDRRARPGRPQPHVLLLRRLGGERRRSSSSCASTTRSAASTTATR